MKKDRENIGKWLFSFLNSKDAGVEEGLKKEGVGNSTLREIEKLLFGMDETACVFDREKIWRRVWRSIRRAEKRRLVFLAFSRYAAFVLFALSVVGVFKMIQQSKKKYEAYVVPVEKKTPVASREAVLVLERGEGIPLSSLKKDTVLTERGISLKIDSSRRISYKKIRSKPEKAVFNTLIVPRGGGYELELADGTRVWMNSVSRLKFPVSFPGPERRVYLEGEAYFRVSPDVHKPFIVESGSMYLEVTGTEFNVCAYADEERVQATLVKGGIKLRHVVKGDTVCLTPGQQAEFRKEGIDIREVNVAHFTSWRTGKFYFDRMSLEDLAKQLERWFDITFYFTNEEVRHFRFTGVIRKDSGIEEIIRILRETTPRISLDLKNKLIMVR